MIEAHCYNCVPDVNMEWVALCPLHAAAGELRDMLPGFIDCVEAVADRLNITVVEIEPARALLDEIKAQSRPDTPP